MQEAQDRIASLPFQARYTAYPLSGFAINIHAEKPSLLSVLPHLWHSSYLVNVHL